MGLSGSDVIHKISSRATMADEAKRAIERNLHALQSELVALSQRKLQLMDIVARTQLDAIANGEKLSYSNSRVMKLLDDRESEFKLIEEQMDELRDLIKQSESEIATNQSMLDTRMAKVNSVIEADSLLSKMSEELTLASKGIPAKTDLADLTKDECGIKLHAFNNSSAFKYLNAQHFGTAQYTGKGLFSWLDSWVAKNIDYAQSRQDYHILNSLPALAERQLDILVEKRREIANRIEAREYHIHNEHGIPEAEGRLKKAVDRLESRRQLISKHQNNLNAYLINQDTRYQSIREELKGTLSSLTLSTLERMAESSKSDADNRAVSEYKEITHRESNLQGQIKHLQTRLEEASNQFKKAKALRDLVSSGDYGSQHRSYRSSFNTDAFISAFLAGTLSSGDARRMIENTSRFSRPDPYRHTSSSQSSSTLPWKTTGSVGGGSKSGWKTTGGI